MNIEFSESDYAQVIKDITCQFFPRQLSGPLVVFYRKQHGAHYSIRRRKERVILLTGLPLNHPQLIDILHRAARGCLEVLQDRTTAAEVRE